MENLSGYVDIDVVKKSKVIVVMQNLVCPSFFSILRCLALWSSVSMPVSVHLCVCVHMIVCVVCVHLCLFTCVGSCMCVLVFVFV